MKNFKVVNLFLFVVISVLIFIFGVAIYSTLDPDMPFQRWDMDHSTTLDSYYLGSNLMPNHLAHPGVGLNFLVSICQYFFF